LLAAAGLGESRARDEQSSGGGTGKQKMLTHVFQGSLIDAEA
jgi:hypothetical protein